MAKMRVANGETASASARAAMSAAHTGLRHSEATRARIGQANRKKYELGPAPELDDIVDADMSRSDLVFVLQNLHFRERDGLGTLKLDRGVRDFLIAALQRNHTC
jgi:hypothetical protein